MKTFNWLHLTDLHHGNKGNVALWPNIQDVFFDDLARLHDKSGPWHAVLFTGDLVQQGKTSEFDALENEVLGPLWDWFAELGSASPVLLSVPGNHDLLRPDIKKPPAALRIMLRNDGLYEIGSEFWEDDDCEYRQIITKAFQSYSSWSDANSRTAGMVINQGILPGDFSATLSVENGSGPTIGIAGINSTFLQLVGGDYKGRLAFGVEQLNKACKGGLPLWVKQHDACILMTHQGPEWYDETTSNSIYREVNPAGRFPVHLFGHMHENMTRTSTYGGGRSLRLWQGRSLFGIEKFGDPPKIERRHGYSAGRIEITEDGSFIRQWPRRAIVDANGWRFEPDNEACVLLENESCTAPERLDSGSPRGKNTKKRAVINAANGSPRVGVKQNKIVRYADDPEFSSYCAAISSANSHIKFVEIPLQKDLSPVQLDRLYVEPEMSRKEIHPDLDQSRWGETITVQSALQKNNCLVILGDPGSGKSTLISCLSWQLCRPVPDFKNSWTRFFAGFLPIPMILRELKLRADLTWEDLIAAFLDHSIGKVFPSRDALERVLKAGNAIVLLDGLDEIGNLTVRRKLRDAVHSGIAAYPKSRWILTSRIIGYDTVPFDVRVEDISADAAGQSGLLGAKSRVKRVTTQVADVLYLAPFNDGQIEKFATNWYSQHEANASVIEQNKCEFVAAIGENEGTRRLARIPYLLTLMALIHHKNASLPHGRTELYERIATAYLEQIDLRRHLDQLPYSLLQKRRWLAEVAYRMQLQRSKKKEPSDTPQILATAASVKRWLKAAMKASSAQGTKEEVDSLIDYFARRSGLLLPRGEGMFAFMHLSLQEYFSACYVESHLTAPRFSKEQTTEPTNDELYMWANHEAWRESFVLLFEMMSQKSVVGTEGLLSHLFEGRLEPDRTLKEATSAGLLGEISTNPFVFLTVETRRKWIQSCWRWALNQDNGDSAGRHFRPFPNFVVRSLVRHSEGDLAKSWESGSITKQELKSVVSLDLSYCGMINDLSPLRAMGKLKRLILTDCGGVRNFDVIESLKNLEVLNIEGCDISTILPILPRMRNLKGLIVGAPIDLGTLKSLVSLSELHLHYPEAAEADLSPLASLAHLNYLCAPVQGHVNVDPALVADPAKIQSKGLRNLLKSYGARPISKAKKRRS